MQRLQSALPHPALRPYVRAYAQRQVPAGDVTAQPVVASLEQVLEFDFAGPVWVEYKDGRSEISPRAVVVGAHSHQRASVRFLGAVESFAVFFQPLGMWQIFGVPGAAVADRAFAAADVLGDAVHALWQRLAEASGFPARVSTMDAFLLEKAKSARGLTPVMGCAAEIFRRGGVGRMDAAASELQMEPRQFQRKFVEATGLRPKQFARIARFQMALDAKLRRPELPWLRIAHAFEYHDQMHLIHDFKTLAGVSPGQLLSLLGDGRPGALAEAGPVDAERL